MTSRYIEQILFHLHHFPFPFYSKAKYCCHRILTPSLYTVALFMDDSQTIFEIFFTLLSSILARYSTLKSHFRRFEVKNLVKNLVILERPQNPRIEMARLTLEFNEIEYSNVRKYNFFYRKAKNYNRQPQTNTKIPCYSRICLFTLNLKRNKLFKNNFDTQQFRNIYIAGKLSLTSNT